MCPATMSLVILDGTQVVADGGLSQATGVSRPSCLEDRHLP